jgi:RNA polymerase sigma-70 factor (ECF subfamily)
MHKRDESTQSTMGASAATALSPAPPTRPTGTLTSAQTAALDFEAVFREMAPYVLRVLPRMGVRSADLDDVAQEVFLAVHRGLGAFEGRSQLRTWVYGICIRVCSNYRRRAHNRYERIMDVPAQIENEARSPERRMQAQRALTALDRALDALSLEQRSAFVLFEVEGLDMLEIARAMGCSKFTAYSRLYAARKHVTKALKAHAQEGER